MEAVSHHFSIADMRHSQAPIIHPARPECSNERSLLEFILLYYFLECFVIQLCASGRLKPPFWVRPETETETEHWPIPGSHNSPG